MTPPLPEGARLALLYWPWGTPTISEIVVAIASARKEGLPPVEAQLAMTDHLLKAGFIEEVVCDPPFRFRLTPAGRRALDEIQSGEAGR